MRRPTDTEYLAHRLYCQVAEWLAWRDGRESLLLSVDLNAWADHRTDTVRWQELFSHASPWDVQTLVRVVLMILAEAQGRTMRETWRRLSTEARWSADHDSIDRLVYWLVTEGDY